MDGRKKGYWKEDLELNASLKSCKSMDTHSPSFVMENEGGQTPEINALRFTWVNRKGEDKLSILDSLTPHELIG